MLSNRNGVVKSVNFNSDQEHIVLRNLDVDSDYQVSVKGQDHSGSIVDFDSNLGIISTDTHTGAINLSDNLYKSIADWSANTNQKVKLSDYLLGIQDGSNNLEIVYFLQWDSLLHPKRPYFWVDLFSLAQSAATLHHSFPQDSATSNQKN